MNAEHARFILQEQERSWKIDGRRKGCSMLQTKDKMKRNVRGGRGVNDTPEMEETAGEG